MFSYLVIYKLLLVVLSIGDVNNYEQVLIIHSSTHITGGVFQVWGEYVAAHILRSVPGGAMLLPEGLCLFQTILGPMTSVSWLL